MSVSKITFDSDDIATMIRNLVLNRDHGYYVISICMLKLSDKSVCNSLDLIFQFCI